MKDRVHFLDSLRALAIIGVLVIHFRSPWAPAGYLGVYVFFALSGYLITQQVIGMRGDLNRLARFVVRRIFRIYPMLWASLALITAVTVWGAENRNIASTEEWLSIMWGHALLVANHRPETFSYAVSVLWTLHAEIWFYLIFSALAYIFGRGVFLFAVLAIAVRWVFGANWLPMNLPLSMDFFFRYADCFAAGVLAYYFVEKRSLKNLHWNVPASLIVLALIGLGWLYTVNVRQMGLGAEAQSAVAYVSAIVIYLYAGAELNWRFWLTEYIGRLSYAMYLLHGVILDSRLYIELRSLFLHFDLYVTLGVSSRFTVLHTLILCTLLLIVGSMFFHHALEQPGIRLGRRVARGLPDIGGAAAANVGRLRTRLGQVRKRYVGVAGE